MAALVEIETNRSHSVNGHITIGRSEGCTIRVDDPLVSPNHAEIVKAPDGTFTIRDLESRRGTYVGTKKVKEAKLRDGDELMIGPIRMRFEDDRVTTRRPDDSDELARLRAVVAFGRAIGVEHDLNKLVERVLETCFALLPADRGAVVLYEPHSKSPHLTITRDRSGPGTAFDVSASVLAQVMVAHEPYLRTEVDNDDALARSQSLCAHGVRSVMAVPLRYEAGEEWLGVIQLDTRALAHVFQPRDLDLLVAIADPAALAIKNAMLVRRVQTVIGAESRRIERLVRDLPLGLVVLDERGRCTMTNAWVSARPIARAGSDGTIKTICGIPSERLIGADLRTNETMPDGRTYSIAARTTENETIIVIADVTEDRERQNQAAHRDRVALIGQLAGGVAHDFNNLLHVILTCAGMLEEAVAHDPMAQDDAQQILHAATSAAELTRQLLTFSRRELVKPSVVDVAAAVQRMEKMLSRTTGGDVELSVTIEPGVPRILIDTAQLEQIVVNLVVNARDAVMVDDKRGKVSLRVSAVEVDPVRANERAIAPGSYALIEVADTGCGMTAETAARVFEPYFTTKARGKGTGLGLATVHGIVQHARGDITVESAPGAGTTFRIVLPATDQRGDEPRVASATTATAGTILLVDDDDSVRRVTERTLRSAGYRVLSASSGQEALTIATGHTGELDLVLTDIVMPGMSGRDLARELEHKRPARVIFMSGYHQNTPLGDAQFIAKPFTRAALLDKVKHALHAEAVTSH